jgi:hypothetical protein
VRCAVRLCFARGSSIVTRVSASEVIAAPGRVSSSCFCTLPTHANPTLSLRRQAARCTASHWDHRTLACPRLFTCCHRRCLPAALLRPTCPTSSSCTSAGTQPTRASCPRLPAVCHNNPPHALRPLQRFLGPSTYTRTEQGAVPTAKPPAMSMSIEELDATVRAFYEGRGETVRDEAARDGAQSRTEANDTLFAAKTSSGDAEPGRRGSFV